MTHGPTAQNEFEQLPYILTVCQEQSQLSHKQPRGLPWPNHYAATAQHLFNF